MRILIDTNVILDVLTRREPHYEHSAALLRLCGTRITGFMTASQTTDIFYMLCREGLKEAEAKAVLYKLTDNLKVIDVTAADVMNALASEISDYEDALLAFCGKRQKVKYIITRNERDFRLSPVPVLTPQTFLESIYEE